MQKPILKGAVAIAALSLGLNAPVMANQTDASVYTSGPAEGSGYYVGADGVIRYRGAGEGAATTGDAPMMETVAPMAVTEPAAGFDGFATMTPIADGPSESVSMQPVIDAYDAPLDISETAPMAMTAPEPVYEYHTDADGNVAMTESIVIESDSYSEAVADVLPPAQPPLQVETLPLEALGDASAGTYSQGNSLPDMYGGAYAPIDVAPAPVITETVVTDSYVTDSYTTDSYVSGESVVYESDSLPVSAPMAETVPLVGSAPMAMEYDAPQMDYMVSDPAPAMEYIESAPTQVAHTDYMAELPAMVDTAPLVSGMEYAARGDGSYGTTQIKRPGEGAAGQRETVSVGKSTILKLPVEAREVIVADPRIVRAILRTAREVVLIGKELGSTNITFLDQDGDQILNMVVATRTDFSGLSLALADAFPNSGLVVDVTDGGVSVSGTVSSAAVAEQVDTYIRQYMFDAMVSAGSKLKNPGEVPLLNRIGMASEDQVLVKVRIAEMRRSAIKQFGVDFNLASDAFLATVAGGGAGTYNTFANLKNQFVVNGASLGGVAANIAGSLDGAAFGGLVRAFEQHNVMRILAEPTLTAVSGEQASFLAGGEFPYPTSIDDGTIGYSYRDFGVALEFRPVVLDGGRISLTVSTEVSELTNEGSLTIGDVTIPGIATRRANTTVELPSGGTMSIAGMLMQRDTASHSGLPGLKNVPVVGQLLSSTDYLKNETELVILVTPYLAKPAQEREFRLPTDGFAPASDFDLFVMGRIHKVYGRGDETLTAARRALKSPFGFIIE